MLKRLYDKTLEWAAHKRATTILFWLAFAESSFFPIPPDLMLMPMVLAQRARAWFIAGICTLGSALGGVAGYVIGFALWDVIGQPMLDFYGYTEQFAEVAKNYDENGALIVFIAGFTPIPYKVITIASGALEMNLLVFFIASVIGRGSRFFLFAGLFYAFGPRIQSMMERYFGLITIGITIVLVGGFAAYEYLK